MTKLEAEKILADHQAGLLHTGQDTLDQARQVAASFDALDVVMEDLKKLPTLIVPATDDESSL